MKNEDIIKEWYKISKDYMRCALHDWPRIFTLYEYATYGIFPCPTCRDEFILNFKKLM